MMRHGYMLVGIGMLLVYPLAGCEAPNAHVQEHPNELRTDRMDRWVDKDYGVACYRYAIETLSCVKLDSLPAEAEP